jgi:hypothetical protein
MAKVPYYPTPEGHERPFISDKLHSVNGVRVPHRMLYPSREMIEAKMREVPAGGATDLVAIRAALAEEHGAASTCPVTTQRVVREIAEASVDAWRAGDELAAPFWRVIDPDRPTADRLAGGADFIRARQQAEER